MNQKQIKWFKLKLNIIPLIDKQAKAVLQLYQQTKKEIVNGDILSIQKLKNIKQQIKLRLKDMDAFYVKYALDSRTKYLFSTRSILSKIIEDQNNFEDFNNSQSSWMVAQTPQKNNNQSNFGIGPNSTQRKQITPQQSGLQSNKALTSRSPLRIIGHQKIQSYEGKQSGMMRLSDLKQQKNRSKSPLKNTKEEKEKGKGTSRKTEQGLKKGGVSKKIEEVIELQRQKQQMGSKLQKGGYDIKKSFKDLSELVFTIKMTKEQYNEFMRQKRKNNHA